MSKEPGDITVELSEHVATIEIQRPPNNFFDVALITQIADALDELAVGDCRAVVLQSVGRHFCAGADFAEPRDGASGPHLYEMAIRLFEQPLPVVAAVQGAAIGGGFGLALSADFRVACPEARFAANFAQLGFHHGFGMTITLPLVAGPQAALELLYSGRRIGGEEAHRLGICDRLVAADELHGAAADWARTIAESAPLAVRSIRQTMRSPIAMQVRDALGRERHEQDRLVATDDWREGVAASSQRRRARFVGT